MFEIFQYDFMVRAFIAGSIVSVIAPLMGNFLVARKYSLLADTLAHVSLVGIAIGLLLDKQPIIVSLLTTIFASLLIERLRSVRNISGESVLALFLSGSLALASVLLSLGRGTQTSLFSYLFGSITTVSTQDIYFIFGIGSVVVFVIAALYKELFFVSLNEELAEASGIAVKRYNLLMIILAATTVTLALRVVGALLIGALLVIPVLTAVQLRRSFAFTTGASIILSFLATSIGLIISYYAALPSGGTIVLVLLAFFMIATFLTHKK